MSLTRLPQVYQLYLSSGHGDREDDDAASVASTISWRTFRTISAPSEILSFTRGAVGSLLGRALNKFGEAMLAPFENTFILRELSRLLEYLDQIEDGEEWHKVESMLNNPKIVDRIFEPLRPMYPRSIRLLAHEVIHVLMIRGQFNLSISDPRLHFSTSNEYQRCVSEHGRFLLALYPKSVAENLLPTSNDDFTFLTDVRLHLSSSPAESSNSSLTPSIRQISRTILRLAVIRGALDTTSRPYGTSALKYASVLFSQQKPKNIQELEKFIQNLSSRLVRIDEQVTTTIERILEYCRLFAISRLLKSRGLDHQSTLDCIYDLGLLYCEQRRWNEAETMLNDALKGYKNVLGPDHQSTFFCIYNLGLSYYEQQRLDEAEIMLNRALEGFEKVFRNDNELTILCVHNLGRIYLAQNRIYEAEAKLDRALIWSEMGLGRDHRFTLDCRHDLGVVYRDQHRLDEAETMFDHALNGCEKLLGPHHESTLHCIQNLGRVYLDQHRLEEAELMLDRALKSGEKVLRRDHKATVDCIHSLGLVYHEQRRLDEAEAMLNRALVTYENELGPDHTSILRCVHNLGLVYRDQHRSDEAEARLERVLKDYEKVLGRDHESTLNCIYNLGLVYHDQHRLDEAESMLDLALKGHERVLGQDHKSTLDCIQSLSLVYQDQRRSEEADAMLHRANMGYEKAFDDEKSGLLRPRDRWTQGVTKPSVFTLPRKSSTSRRNLVCPS